VETSQHLFKELEEAEKLFSDGAIKNAQKKVRNVLKQSRALSKIPNKLRHKINAATSKSRYFDEISSFAANPKRDSLIGEINTLINNPLDNPKKHAHVIHDIQAQWQLLDISSKPASKQQWLKFNELTNKAWEPCKEYFEEIKEIKLNNAKEREILINEINGYVNENEKKWKNAKDLIIYLQKIFQRWQKFTPVLDDDFILLKNKFFEAKKPINDEIKKQENINAKAKELLIEKVAQINNEDSQICINEFKKLKDEWVKIGIAGKKTDKILWDKFNKNADRFFEEKKQIIKDEIELIKNLNKELNEGTKSIGIVNDELSKIQNVKNTQEFKKIISDIRKQSDKLNIEKKEKKAEAYKNIYASLIKKDTADNIPSIFSSSVTNSYNESELHYACIKLEILAGIDSLKKDIELRNSIQLELLSNKFNKSNKSVPNDLESLLLHFINHFSIKDEKNIHKKLWKRIEKCIEILI
jgi:hypothetical protein